MLLLVQVKTMNRLICCALYLTVLPLLCWSERAVLVQGKMETGTQRIDLRDISVQLRIDGHPHLQECAKPYPNGNSFTGDSICTFSIEAGLHHIYVIIGMPSYKPLSVNIANFNAERSKSVLNLGTLVLKPLIGPTITQVVPKKSADGSILYQFTFRNPTKQSFFVNSIDIHGEIFSSCSVRDESSRAFKIARALKVTGAEGKIDIQGLISDLSDNKDFSAVLTGWAEIRACGASALQLNAKIAFILPPEHYFTLDLLVPHDKRFVVSTVESPFRHENIRAISTDAIDVFDYFPSLKFTFKTSEPDIRTIGVGIYQVVRERRHLRWYDSSGRGIREEEWDKTGKMLKATTIEYLSDGREKETTINYEKSPPKVTSFTSPPR
jgi:hypothetical protein